MKSAERELTVSLENEKQWFYYNSEYTHILTHSPLDD